MSNCVQLSTENNNRTPNDNKVGRKKQMNNQVEIIMPGDDVDIIEIIQGNVIFGFNK